jgi:hypothetical protein
MSVLAIILIVLAVLVLGLFTLGLWGATRARAAGADEFAAKLAEANEALADARAADRGWDPAALEATARAAVERRNPDANVRGVHLVQVVDRPGTDDDEAHFHVDVAMGRDLQVVLGRRDGEWTELQSG